MPTIRRPPCSYSYTELVAHSCSPYKLEGPGCLYFPLRGTEISDIDAFLDGTVLTQAQFNALQIKAGHTAKFERQFGEAIDSPQAESEARILPCSALIRVQEKTPRVLLARQRGGFGGVQEPCGGSVPRSGRSIRVVGNSWKTVYHNTKLVVMKFTINTAPIGSLLLDPNAADSDAIYAALGSGVSLNYARKHRIISSTKLDNV
ncbi:hypothetical protein B0H14DRAFT_2624888 [Mycena olivaceomarginata]|nr:hypothetical protein B0H14DRAFT_2624888 [Mycena olivaceomarginata]